MAIALSIVIVTRNTRVTTCEAIRSVFGSVDAPEFQIVLVDNGSADQTAEEVERLFPTVKTFRAGQNLGFSKACNLGASACTGEFLLLLNSDARLQPEALARAVAHMRANPECGVAGGQLLNPDGSRQNSIANAPTLATELLNKSLLRRLFPTRYPGKEQQYSTPLEVESVVGAFFLVRRKLWNELGGLDERFFFFLEETDFCLQARSRGWQVCHLPSVLVWHEQGKSAKQWSSSARIEYWRSRYAYFQKNHSPAVLAVLRTGLVMRLFVDFLGAALLAAFSFGTSEKWNQKVRNSAALVSWHFSGLPAEAGLPRN